MHNVRVQARPEISLKYQHLQSNYEASAGMSLRAHLHQGTANAVSKDNQLKCTKRGTAYPTRKVLDAL